MKKELLILFLILMPLALAAAPTTETVSIIPSHPTNTQDLKFYCQVNDTDGDNIYLNWTVWRNGVVNTSSTATYTPLFIETIQNDIGVPEIGNNGPLEMGNNGTHLFISDQEDDEVYVYDLQGNHITNWSSTAANSDLRSIAYNGSHIFIGDDPDDEIYIYLPNGTYVTSWDTAASGMTTAKALASNGSSLFVAQNSATYTVFEFDYQGNYIKNFTATDNAVAMAIKDNILYIMNSTEDITRYRTNGTALDSTTWFDLTSYDSSMDGITINGDYLYATGSLNDNIEKFYLHNPGVAEGVLHNVYNASSTGTNNMDQWNFTCHATDLTTYSSQSSADVWVGGNSNLTFTGSKSGNDYSSEIYCLFDGEPLDKRDDYYYELDVGTTTLACEAGSSFGAYSSTVYLANSSSTNTTTHSVPEYTLNLTFSSSITGTYWWIDDVNTDDSWNISMASGKRNFTGNLSNSTADFCTINNCYVVVEFNYDSSGKQVYEVYNDYETQITEDLKVLSTMDNFIYFKTQGMGNDNINKVLLEFFTLDDGAGDKNYTKIGQRFSNDDGLVTVYTDSADYLVVKATKEGYTTLIRGYNTDEFNNVSNTNPLVINLVEGETFRVNEGIYSSYPKRFTNESDWIELYYTGNKDYFYFNTSYYGTTTKVNTNTLGIGVKKLTSGTHYTDASFTIYFYDENFNLVYNTTHAYVGIEEKDIFSQFPSISSDRYPIIILILIIVFSILIGATVSPEKQKTGMHTFFLSVMLMTFIVPQFWGASLIALFYYASKNLFNTQET